MKHTTWRHGLTPVLLFGLISLLLILSACSPSGGGNGPPPVQGKVPTATATTPSTPTAQPVQTVAMPPTQTDCPAISSTNPFGTRAAVMRPLALGQHNNLVYVYNEVPTNTTIAYGHLERYDVATGARTTIVTSGVRIQEAQVSTDGQWIMFLTIPDARGDRLHAALLQLVRMDGQGLQTLYCFPSLNYGYTSTPSTAGSLPVAYLPISFQWSADQRHVLLSSEAGGNISRIDMLDITTGAMRGELLISDSLFSYRAMTWLDNSRAYVLTVNRQGPAQPVTLYLLDTAATTNPTSPSWVVVLKHAVRFSDLAMDSSYDGRTLFVSYCLQAASPFDSTVSSEPATGGTQQTIYHQAPTTCLENMRAISSTNLLLLVETATVNMSDQEQHIGLLATNGSGGLHLLNTLPGGNSYTYTLNNWTQLPWSNVSRDGALYSLNAYKVLSSNPYQVQTTTYYGSLSGGNVVTVATTNGLSNVEVAGWTLM
jgi:hypothetical protein